MEELQYLAYDSPESQIIYSIIGHDSSRYNHIYSCLRDQIIPSNLTRNEKRNLIQNASRYVTIANDLFRRGLDGTLIRCLETEESQCALSEVHEGICGSHSNGLTLARKLLKVGYYWQDMEKDAIKFAKTFQKCALHGNLIHAPTRDLIPFVTHWPFQQCTFDLIGQIYPASSSRHKFIITVTENFTKWVKVVPLIKEIGKQISMFILNYIIYRYGIPSSIVTDNRGQFKNKDLDELCEKFKIK